MILAELFLYNQKTRKNMNIQVLEYKQLDIQKYIPIKIFAQNLWQCLNSFNLLEYLLKIRVMHLNLINLRNNMKHSMELLVGQDFIFEHLLIEIIIQNSQIIRFRCSNSYTIVLTLASNFNQIRSGNIIMLAHRILIQLYNWKSEFSINQNKNQKRQIFGTGQTTKTQTQNLVKYEVMDSCPAKGQIIPIRLYLSGVQLTPSYKNINSRLQVKHAINLILIDEQDRRYFKQHEIFIYRRK